MGSPFDNVNPIRRAADAGRRRTPREDAAARGRAASVATEPEDADKPQIPAKPPARLDRELTHGDASRMVAITARRALQVIENPHAKDVDKKHAAVSLGVAIDKWLALTSRPARPEAEAKAEAMRDGVIELALRLAEAVAGRSTTTAPVTTNGTPTRG